MKRFTKVIFITLIMGILVSSSLTAQPPKVIKYVIGTGGVVNGQAGGIRMWGITGQVAIESKSFNGNTVHQGFWVPDSTSPVGVEEYTESKSLLNNYPNPFSIYTVIRYNLQSTSNVTLRIYDMLGQEKVILANSIQNEGPQEITWYGTDHAGLQLPSGSYYYELQVTPAQIAGGEKVTQSLRNVMIIVR